jgi:hypothetical protein
MSIVPQGLPRLLALATLLGGCGGDGSGPAGPPPNGGIGPAGGTVTSSDGRATLVVPPNALSASTAVTLAIQGSPPLDPSVVGGSAYRLGPDGVQFSVPAVLTIWYDPALSPIGVAEADLRMHRLAAGAWTPEPASTIDAAAHTASVSVTTGGGYGVRWPGLPGPCTTPEHRQFDFWLGQWDFVVPGAPGGSTNSITADPDGCAINEDFQTPVGVNGRSVSFYNPGDQQWHQTYIDNTGTRLRMSGRLEGSTMLLYPSPTTRFGWTPGDDQVRYYGESSSDGGVTWTVTFNSRYVRP